MRRKKFRTIYGDVDGLESPEGSSLVVPSRRLFSPNLSKSAPCKCCVSGTLTNYVLVNGCGGFPLPNASVTIVPPAGGSASPSSGVTDATGKFFFNGTGSGTFFADVSATRFVTQNNVSLTGTLPNLTTTVNLVVATGYHCTAQCNPPFYDFAPYPLPNTIHGTTPYGSTIAFTFNTLLGYWLGNDPQTITVCQGGTGLVTVRWSFNNGCLDGGSWVVCSAATCVPCADSAHCTTTSNINCQSTIATRSSWTGPVYPSAFSTSGTMNCTGTGPYISGSYSFTE